MEEKSVREKLNLLWVDLQVSEDSSGPDTTLKEFFNTSECGRNSRIAQQFEKSVPDVICFDFDFPDRAGLKMVEEIKRLFPSIPMFVCTVQHSEELAVWAFRSRMTDFLTKPLVREELRRTVSVLEDIRRAKRGQEGRNMAKSKPMLPESAIRKAPDEESRLQPAIYFVQQNFREKIRAETVAKLCNMSTFRFSRQFKDIVGIAFRDYVVRYRLREAYHQLKTGQVSVTEAAYANGFNDVGYFSRMFKRHFNVCPSQLDEAAKGSAEVEDSPTVRLQLPIH
jgi:AraC-like DNA-binding protein